MSCVSLYELYNGKKQYYIYCCDDNINKIIHKNTYIINNDNIEDIIENNIICSICLSLFEKGDTVNKLKCGHLFHDECITTWLTNDNMGTCPNCRKSIL